MEKPAFSFVDLSEKDHQYAGFKYSGNDIQNSICICALSPSSISLFSSLVENSNPAGFFITSIYDIINPIDYANGNDPSTKFIRSFRNEVYIYNNITIILYEKSNICTKESVNAIFDLVHPETILVFNSTSSKDFIGSVTVPKLYFLSNYTDSNLDKFDKLPSPNKIQNLAAGLLINGEINKVKVCVYDLVEDLYHPTIQSMELILSAISDLIQCETDIKAKQAVQIATTRFAYNESHDPHSLE